MYTELCSMLCGIMDEGVWGENTYTYMYSWVPSVFTWNCHNIVNRLSVQLLCCVWLFVTPWAAACQASLSITNSWSLLKLNVHRVSDAIQPSYPLSSPSPPAFNLSQHQGFSNESVLLIRWPNYWSFSFSISSSNGYSGLISFRIDLISLQSKGLKSLLQHNSKTSIIGYTPIQNKV